MRVKHVIEPRIRYRFVDGIDNFDKVIRFDGRDLLTNTNEADISIMNRLYAKDAATGGVREVASLEIWQRRYFDPEFGGALVPGRRNVFSFEWRRFAIGHTRNENQFRVALSIANVGSFGTLSPRERMF